jgi:hypothetical protein
MLASELKTRFSNLKHDITDVTDTILLNWIDELNRWTYNKLAGIDPERLISQQNYTVTHKDQRLTLPADFQSLQHWGAGFYYNTTNKLGYIAQTGAFTAGLTVTGGTSGATATIEADVDSGVSGYLTLSSVSGTFTIGETITDSATGSATMSIDPTITERKLWETGHGATTPGFYITGGTASPVSVITGISTSTVFTLRYLPKVTPITALANTLVIPDEYMEFALRALDVKYTIWTEDPNAESLADFRYVRALDEFAANVRRSPAVYGLNDYSLYY